MYVEQILFKHDSLIEISLFLDIGNCNQFQVHFDSKEKKKKKRKTLKKKEKREVHRKEKRRAQG